MPVPGLVPASAQSQKPLLPGWEERYPWAWLNGHWSICDGWRGKATIRTSKSFWPASLPWPHLGSTHS